jgi:maltose O-acetyltransferase
LPIIGNVIEQLRQFSLRLMGATIGNNSYIRFGAEIYYPGNLSIGDNCRINNNCKLYLFEKLTIGNNVIIGPELFVYTGDHNIYECGTFFSDQTKYNIPVSIGDDVYIGARITILKGVVIENRVVVAAGAVVTEKLKSGYVYGGVPAKRIKCLMNP